jgi:hypothetical protein
MNKYTITTKPSIYERLADWLLAIALGVFIAFGLFVFHVSSGIVAVSFSDRLFALAWIADNNYLLDEPANLYKLVKAKA